MRTILPPEHPTNATSTFIATAEAVINQFRVRAAALKNQNFMQNLQPLITDRTEAQDHANCLNLQNHAVIGGKEGATEDTTLQFGTDVTDSVLKTANRVDYKGIDDYHLYNLVQDAIQGELIVQQQATFLATSPTSLQRNLTSERRSPKPQDSTRTASIVMTHRSLVPTYSQHRSGIKTTLQTICHQYNYMHVHIAATIVNIRHELAAADAVQQLKDAPAPARGVANDMVEQYSTLV